MTTRIVCIGGLVLDRKLRLGAEAVAETSNPASATTAAGGVARNVAENLTRLGAPSGLVSTIGADEAGRALVAGLRVAGVDVRGVREVEGATTAEYVAVLQPSGELVIAAAVMEVLASVTHDDVAAAWPEPGSWVFAETNLASSVLSGVVARARRTGVRLALDAVSVPKAARLPDDLNGVAVLFCNRDEARALAGRGAVTAGDAAQALRARGAESVVVTLGADGALVVAGQDSQHVPGARIRVRDVTGAGDTLIAATLAALARGAALVDAVRAGVVAAAHSIS